MDGEKLAVLLPFFDSVESSRRISFLMDIDKKVDKGTLAVIGNAKIPSHIRLNNLRLIIYRHDRSVSAAFRRGFEIAMENHASKAITFSDYSLGNSTWFAPYLLLSDVVEHGKRSFSEMLVTEITNLLSFRSVYSAFSMNRIIGSKTIKLLLEKGFDDKIALRITNLMSSANIKVTEVVRNDRQGQTFATGVRDTFHSVLTSINKSTFLYGLFSSFSYLLNIFIVYISINLGLFYPISLLFGQEISALSNFIAARNVSLKSRNLSFSSFGKYNGIVLAFVLIDVLVISTIGRYAADLDLSASIFAVIVTVAVSVISMITLNKFVWGNSTLRIKYA